MDHKLDFNRSYSRWLSFKDSCHNSYTFQALKSSWTGQGVETTIKVTNGVPVERTILNRVYSHPNGILKVDTLLFESEAGAQLGISGYGLHLFTLDEIYNEAKNNWLQKRDDVETYFEANNNGMISTAAYRQSGCQDDCSIGVNIQFIRPN